MLALYCSGRQTDALASYRGHRQRFAYELGLEPGRPLQDLEQQILRTCGSILEIVWSPSLSTASSG
jgi:DNA-binding SARP family transcriptional activator